MRFISTAEEYDTLKRDEKYQFKCKCCGNINEYTKRHGKAENESRRKLLCKLCLFKQNNLEKYGVENPSQLDNIKKKKEATFLEHYGEIVNFKTKEFKENVYKNFGVHHALTHYIEYDNIKFDSTWELCFYIYHKDQNHNIVREPKMLNYSFNNENHCVIPDFEVDGKLYEIKGDHFFENGKMINPFDRSLDDLAEAKHSCLKNNNVTILTSSEIKKFQIYVNSKYGKNFISSLQRKDK